MALEKKQKSKFSIWVLACNREIKFKQSKF